MRKILVGLALILIIIGGTFSAVAEPQTSAALTQDRMETLDILLFSESVQFALPKNTVSYWFSIPANITLGEDNQLNLHFAASETLLDDRSSISVSVNGTFLESRWLTPGLSTQSGWWNIEIPIDLLRVGALNDLTITTAQRSIEGDCADIDNPSNWVRLDADSYLHLTIAARSSLYLQDVYSYFYDNLENKTAISGEFVLGKGDQSAAANSMLKIASAIGREYPYKDVLDFFVSTGAPKSNAENKIFVGLFEDWANRFALPEVESGEGYLQIADKTETADYYKTLVLGDTAAGLKKATDFFSNTAVLSQISDAQTFVTSEVSDLQKEEFSVETTGFYRFSDFGYDDISLAGAFHQSTTMNFRQPEGVKSGADSYINVKFRHSKALYSDNSLLTVYVNGTAIDSAKLSASNAESGELKVYIPSDALAAETITVKIDVYNYLGKVDCSKDYYDTAWTVIDKDSEIYFDPGDVAISPTLSSYPFFEAPSGQNAQVSFILPEDSGDDTLALAALTAIRAGQTNGRVYNCEISTGALSAIEQDKDMVIIGAYGEVEIPEDVNALLRIAPNADGSVNIDDSLAITTEGLSGKLVFQAVRSPWNFQRKIYVLLYEKGMEKLANEFLSDRQRLNELTGSVAIVDARGNVTNFAAAVQDDAEQEIPMTIERAKYLAEKSTGVPIWMLGVAVVLVLIIIILIVKVSRDRARFAKAAKKIEEQNEDYFAVRTVGEKLPETPESEKDGYPPEEQ